MDKAPCGKDCSGCPLFRTSCEGCVIEMSLSFAYRCKAYYRSSEKGSGERTGIPCPAADAKGFICPLLVQKSMRPEIHLGSGPETPIE